jgi:hypothetical protein
VPDENGRAVFYYPNVMTEYGVSKFRMNDYPHIRITADLLSLVPVDMGTGQGFMSQLIWREMSFLQ